MQRTRGTLSWRLHRTDSHPPYSPVVTRARGLPHIQWDEYQLRMLDGRGGQPSNGWCCSSPASMRRNPANLTGSGDQSVRARAGLRLGRAVVLTRRHNIRAGVRLAALDSACCIPQMDPCIDPHIATSRDPIQPLQAHAPSLSRASASSFQSLFVRGRCLETASPSAAILSRSGISNGQAERLLSLSLGLMSTS